MTKKQCPKITILVGCRIGKLQPKKIGRVEKVEQILAHMILINVESRGDLCVAAVVLVFRHILMSKHVFGV